MPGKSVKGRRVLVTGTAAGLGREIALVLARRGANLLLWDVNATGNEETARQARALGSDAVAHTVNMADAEAITAAAAETKEVWGVINNAGIVNHTSFLEGSDARTELVFKVNLFAHMRMAKCFLPSMIEANDGVFVSVTSVASYFGAPGMVDYAASKAAARVFMETLAQEVAMKAPGVHLANACPSLMDTALFDGFGAGDPFNAPLKASDVARYIVDNLIEARQACGVWPWPARLAATLKGMWPESLWQVVFWRQLRKLMSQHNPKQQEEHFAKMAPASKL